MGIAAIIGLGGVASILATAPAIAAEGDLSWRDRHQAQAEVSRLDREITANPNDPNNYNERAMLKDKLGERQGALADYNQAITSGRLRQRSRTQFHDGLSPARFV